MDAGDGPPYQPLESSVLPAHVVSTKTADRSSGGSSSSIANGMVFSSGNAAASFSQPGPGDSPTPLINGNGPNGSRTQHFDVSSLGESGSGAKSPGGSLREPKKSISFWVSLSSRTTVVASAPALNTALLGVGLNRNTKGHRRASIQTPHTPPNMLHEAPPKQQAQFDDRSVR